MSGTLNGTGGHQNRRNFLKTGFTAAGAAAAGLVLSEHSTSAAVQSGGLTAGDAAILQFLAAGELLEADFWTQYNHDDTDDEISHATFINAYLVSRGAEPVSLDAFRTLEGSKATGSSGKPRLTNLMLLTIDSSWWTRYRSSTNNPDVNPAVFEQAVPDLHNGQHTAIPRTDDDLYPHPHIQAIANTAAFQMPTVEQGGGSLRMALAQRATDAEVLRLLISMGPIESMHFQTWHEKAGKVRPMTDPTTGLSFPDLNSGIDPNTGARGSAVRQMFQTNLIMPEPCPFISTSLPACSVIRPTNTTGAATGALKFLTAMGLFIGQSPAFFSFLSELAAAADAAQRGM